MVRAQVVELDIREVDVAAEGWIRFRQQIGLAITGHSAGLEHDRREPDVRRIRTLRAAIADVGRDQLDVANV
jgi:hypothetical protein